MTRIRLRVRTVACNSIIVVVKSAASSLIGGFFFGVDFGKMGQGQWREGKTDGVGASGRALLDADAGLDLLPFDPVVKLVGGQLDVVVEVEVCFGADSQEGSAGDFILWIRCEMLGHWVGQG